MIYTEDGNGAKVNGGSGSRDGDESGSRDNKSHNAIDGDARSCLGDGDDGNLYYEGFTVYTYREDGEETVTYVE